MRPLRLCDACKRHIRVRESLCPFCGAEQAPCVEAPAGRPRGRPGGRAALFLAGAAAAPGCVLEHAVPVYGIPIDAAPGVSDAARPDAGPPMAVPVYGVPIERDAEAMSDAGGPARDAAPQDVPCGDAGPPMAVPVYGVPVDSGARDASADGSPCGPDADASIGVPVYGVPLDPGPTPDASRLDGGILGVPVYGLWLEIDEPEE